MSKRKCAKKMNNVLLSWICWAVRATLVASHVGRQLTNTPGITIIFETNVDEHRYTKDLCRLYEHRTRTTKDLVDNNLRVTLTM